MPRRQKRHRSGVPGDHGNGFELPEMPAFAAQGRAASPETVAKVPLAGLSLRPPVYPATGIVEYQGRPLPGATVTFLAGKDDGTDPQAQMAYGLTDSSGRFRLRRFPQYEGAVAGDYRVSVTKVEYIDTTPPDPDPARDYPPLEKSVLPDRYCNADTSGLTATVTPEGPNSYHFLLK